MYSGLSFVFGSGERIISDASIKYIFYAAAAVLAVASFALFNYKFSEKSLKKQLLRDINIDELSSDNATNKVDKEKKRVLETLSKEERKLYALSSSFQIPYIISWALNESIVLFGFISSYMFKDALNIVPFAIIAAALHFQMYPRLLQIVEKALTMPELNQ
ncbi:MAG: hypothetical protein ACRENO_00235 [Thermodesulfobacteriota bacterium]